MRTKNLVPGDETRGSHVPRALIPRLQTQAARKKLRDKIWEWSGVKARLLGYTKTAVLHHDSCFPVLLLVTAGPVEQTTHTVRCHLSEQQVGTTLHIQYNVTYLNNKLGPHYTYSTMLLI